MIDEGDKYFVASEEIQRGGWEGMGYQGGCKGPMHAPIHKPYPNPLRTMHFVQSCMVTCGAAARCPRGWSPVAPASGCPERSRRLRGPRKTPEVGWGFQKVRK
jgi:hypothetical protein